MAMQQLQLAPGSRVATSDGQIVGHVAEVRDAYFKVDAPWRRDYWLPTSLVSRANSAQIALAVPRGSLGNYHVGQPVEDEGDEVAPATGPFSEVEMQEQRERLERELAESQPHQHVGA